MSCCLLLLHILCCYTFVPVLRSVVFAEDQSSFCKLLTLWLLLCLCFVKHLLREHFIVLFRSSSSVIWTHDRVSRFKDTIEVLFLQGFIFFICELLHVAKAWDLVGRNDVADIFENGNCLAHVFLKDHLFRVYRPCFNPQRCWHLSTVRLYQCGF